jgi:parallel beta-helix repeat protein
MQKKVVLSIMMLVLSMSFLNYGVDETASVSPSVVIVGIVEPQPPIEVMVCNSFEIRINVTNVTDLGSFIVALSFNNAMMWVLEAKNGTSNVANLMSFDPVSENGTVVPLGNSNATGVIRLKGQYYSPVSGNETLAVIKFKCHSAGNSYLTLLPDTKLQTPSLIAINRDLSPPCMCKQVTTRSDEIPIDRNYTLCTDLNFTGSLLFNIVEDNVVLDLNNRLITSNTTGIAIQATNKSNICIKNGELDTFQHGVWISNCTNVKIINMTFIQPKVIGIYVTRGTRDFTIANCKFRLQGLGESIFVSESDHGVISDNTISENDLGIQILQSSDCTITRNVLSYNNIGLVLNNAHSNTIFNNDFVGSMKNHTQLTSSTNCTWNAVYPLGGNYWDNYKGNDDFSGTNLTALRVPGSDGIGDTPYSVGDNNLDQYPLMHSRSSVPKLNVFSKGFTRCLHNETRTYLIGLYADSIISSDSFVFDRTWNNETSRYEGSISFNVTRSTFCKAIICRELLDGVLEVFVDDVPTACFLNWEGNLTCGYVYADFIYNISEAHTIKIKGQVVTRLEGDLDGNCIVNIIDFAIAARNFGDKIEPKP